MDDNFETLQMLVDYDISLLANKLDFMIREKNYNINFVSIEFDLNEKKINCNFYDRKADLIE